MSLSYFAELVKLGAQMTKWIGKEVTIEFNLAMHGVYYLEPREEDSEWFKELVRLDVWKKTIASVDDSIDLADRMVLLSGNKMLRIGRTFWFEGVEIKEEDDKVSVSFNWGS